MTVAVVTPDARAMVAAYAAVRKRWGRRRWQRCDNVKDGNDSCSDVDRGCSDGDIEGKGEGAVSAMAAVRARAVVVAAANVM